MAGPLDELFPGWRAPGETPELRPLHARVLEVPLASPGGDQPVAFTLVLWRDPGGPVEVHGRLRRAIESTLLAELSRPPHELRGEGTRGVRALRLVAFEEVERFDDAVRAFGLKRVVGVEWAETLAQVRGEASRIGHEVPDTPVASFEADFACRAGFEDELRAELGQAVFGAKPGEFFAALNRVREAQGEPPLTPTLASLDTLEAALVPAEEGCVRWIPSATFQALCDAVAVVAQADLGRTVQWGESQIEDDGLAPPPMIRLKDGAAFAHVPLGLDLMRWCVMPRGAGEEIPSLSAWARDRFGPAS